MAAQFAALPWLGRPDLIVSVSPSFPALLPAMVNARVRGVPWALWLQDILPDGASATGLIDSGGLLRSSRRGVYRQPRRQGRAHRQDRARPQPRYAQLRPREMAGAR